MKMWTLIVAAVLMAGGCGSDEKTTTIRERQDKALNDPFKYSPYEDWDVSGGKVGEFKKDAFKKDVDTLLNP